MKHRDPEPRSDGLVSHAARVLDRRYAIALAVLLVTLAVFAWSQRFMLDDAFISFRYAHHLVEGHGLVWNPGEPAIEGYTNFLWTLIVSVPIALGLDPVSFCYATGPPLAVLTLLITARITELTLDSRPLALLAVLLLGTNPTFAAFATGGLETQLVAVLVATVTWLVLGALRAHRLGAGRAAALSAIAALSVMARPDSAVILAAGLFSAGWLALRAGKTSARRGPAVVALVVPFALIIGGWLVWKLDFYGQILPNTLHAKTGAQGAAGRGLNYVAAFFASTLLAPFPFLFAAGGRRALREQPAVVYVLMLPLLAQLGYLVWIGGDFMEFRLLVPVLPLLFVLIVWSCVRLVQRPEARVALLLLVLVGSVHHAARFPDGGGIESLRTLESHLDDPDQNWIGIGRRLDELFGDSPDVPIAVTAAGAVPYYSRLPTLDMLGLSDPWIAEHGTAVLSQPGHTWVAPLSYLVAQQVHLVIVHPWVVGPSTPRSLHPRVQGLGGFVFLTDTEPELLTEASLLGIPLGSERFLITLYLTPHPAIERAAREGGWQRSDVRDVMGG